MCFQGRVQSLAVSPILNFHSHPKTPPPTHTHTVYADVCTTCVLCETLKASKNLLLLPQFKSCYFTRFFRDADGAVLVTHQSFAHVYPVTPIVHTYIAPYKATEADSEGTLRLKWWNKNANLKGRKRTVSPMQTPSQSSPPLPPLLPALQDYARIVMLNPVVNVSLGAIFEVTFTLPPAPPSASYGSRGKASNSIGDPGFVFNVTGHSGDGGNGGLYRVTVDHAGVCNIATPVDDDVGPAGAVVNNADDAYRSEGGSHTTRGAPSGPLRWDRDLVGLSVGDKVKVRLLYRRDMLELYLNDYLLPVYLMANTTGAIGVTGLDNVDLKSVKLWDMDVLQ